MEYRTFVSSARSEASGLRQSLGPDLVGGLAGDGSVVVVDDFDVVAVGVEHEGAVVARVVRGAFAGGAVVLVACGERGGVEGLDGRSGSRA
jgi:hypothetical protein